MNNRILAFYKKRWKTRNGIQLIGEEDGTEYIYYIEKGTKYLTSGSHRWNKTERYLPFMEKVESINLYNMRDKLKDFYPYSWLTSEIEKMME